MENEDKKIADRLVDRGIRLLNGIDRDVIKPKAIVFTDPSPDVEPYGVLCFGVVLQLLRVSGFSPDEIESMSKLLADLPEDNVAVVIALKPGSLFFHKVKPSRMNVFSRGEA